MLGSLLSTSHGRARGAVLLRSLPALALGGKLAGHSSTFHSSSSGAESGLEEESAYTHKAQCTAYLRNMPE